MAIAAGQVMASGDVTLFRQIQTGIATISFTTQTSNSTAVTFSPAFAVAPQVHVNINTAPGSTAGWATRAINITTTGFTIFSFGTSNTWVSVPVAWTAVSN